MLSFKRVLIPVLILILPVIADTVARATDFINYNVGGNSRGICTSDFNLDGRPDLAVVESWNGRIMILFDTGNGHFAAAVQYYPARPFYPYVIAAGDFNGDHVPDLAMSNSGAVSIMLNDGTGSFGEIVSYPVGGPPTGQFENTWSQSICTTDLNGDGTLDLVTANEPSMDISVLMNHGDGTFAPSVNYPVGDLSEYASAGDLNGDGIPDIVSLCQGGLTVFVNDGTGVLTTGPRADVGTRYVAGTYPFDFDEDGQPEILACLPELGKINVYRPNFASGTCALIASLTTSHGVRYLSLSDFNNDGHIDLAACVWADSLVVFRNDGQGKFTVALAATTTNAPQEICSSDFDGDLHPDVAVAAIESDSITVLTGIGAGCCFGLTGNVDGIGVVNLADLSTLVSYLTNGKITLPCPDAANVNGSGIVNLADLSALVSYLGGGGFSLPYCQ